MSDLDTTRPFGRADALTSGLTDADLRSARFRRLFRGVHVDATVLPTLIVRVRAALVVAPTGAVVSHHTAAVLWGGIVPAAPDVHLLVRRSARCGIPGIRVHRSNHPVRVGRRSGVRLTAPETTFAQLAVELSLVDLIVLGDSLVASGATTPAKLRAFADGFTGRGRLLARRAASLVRAGVGSPRESRLRLLIVLAGLPEPVVDHCLADEHGVVRRRLDLAYPEAKVAIEYDGAYHDKEVQHGADLVRREDLEAEGWTFVVVVHRHLHDTPDQVLDRVARAARSGGLRVPQALADEWRAHFPGRTRGSRQVT